MAGYGDALGKLSQQFQGRIERAKNEREKLLKEKESLEKKRPITDAINARVCKINERVDELDGIIRTKATD